MLTKLQDLLQTDETIACRDFHYPVQDHMLGSRPRVFGLLHFRRPRETLGYYAVFMMVAMGKERNAVSIIKYRRLKKGYSAAREPGEVKYKRERHIQQAL